MGDNFADLVLVYELKDIRQVNSYKTGLGACVISFHISDLIIVFICFGGTCLCYRNLYHF